MGDESKQPWVSNFGQQPAVPDTERTVMADPVSQDAAVTPMPVARRDLGSTGTLTFATVVAGEADIHTVHPESLLREQKRPEPARELDMQTLAQPVKRLVNPQNNGDPTLQSLMRPDLLVQTVSDPRRFLSIERELNETSAANKFLEKRLNRLEKDSRLALGLAAFAILLAVVGFLL